MRSCKEVSRLLSLSQEQKLTLPQRLELKMHLTICKHCKRLNANLLTIQAATKGFAKGDNEDGNKK